ncbi:hypothetical protein D3C87_2189830 [compost metagenome]
MERHARKVGLVAHLEAVASGVDDASRAHYAGVVPFCGRHPIVEFGTIEFIELHV